MIWNHKEYEVDVPMFKQWIASFISRAIYDGAVTYRYIIDAEVSDVRVQFIIIIISMVIHQMKSKSFNRLSIFCH